MSINVQIVPVTLYQQNCSIVVCEKTNKAAVVDPGGDLERIEAALKTTGATLDKILITHGHLDHCAGTKELAQKYDVPIEGPHIDDQFWIDQLPEACAQMNFPPAEPFTSDRYLEDGDSVELGELSFDVIHCPGHTPGHVVFFAAEQKLAVVGDVLFKGSIGRTDFPRGNHQDLLDSITQKLWPLGDDVQFIPGHGPTSTFGYERQTNPFVADARYR